MQEVIEVAAIGNNIVLYIGMGIALCMSAYTQVSRLFLSKEKEKQRLIKSILEVMSVSGSGDTKKTSVGKANKLYAYNPHPPGEASVCKSHTEALEENQKTINAVAVSLASMKGETSARLAGIDSRLNKIEAKL